MSLLIRIDGLNKVFVATVPDDSELIYNSYDATLKTFKHEVEVEWEPCGGDSLREDYDQLCKTLQQEVATRKAFEIEIIKANEQIATLRKNAEYMESKLVAYKRVSEL